MGGGGGGCVPSYRHKESCSTQGPFCPAAGGTALSWEALVLHQKSQPPTSAVEQRPLLVSWEQCPRDRADCPANSKPQKVPAVMVFLWGNTLM